MKLLASLRLMTAMAGACAPMALLAPQAAQAQFAIGVTITANVAPPPLPYYEQPPIPGPNFIWAPGYWAWDSDEGDYYWVPGAWVEAPQPGLLWTPGYWGWADDVYVFHSGYWGPHIGFYGGVAYGFGYTGFGYHGGYWRGGNFFYNRTVNHITNVNITNVYNQNVTVNRTTVNNVSFNGGPGGVQARATPQEQAFAREPHVAPTPMQAQHQRMAAATPAQFARANGGRPAIAATPRANVFQGPGVVHGAGPRPAGADRPGGFSPGGPMRPTEPGGPERPGDFERPEGLARPDQPPGRPRAPAANPDGGYDGADREARPAMPRDDFGAPPAEPHPQAEPRPQGEPDGFPGRPPQPPRPQAAPRPQAPHPQAPRPPARPHPAPPRPHPAPHHEDHR